MTSLGNSVLRQAIFLGCMGLTTFALAQRQESQVCTNLSHLKIPNVKNIYAGPVVAGEFEPVSGKKIVELPAFCRVVILDTPTPGSNIRIENWLPTMTWNHRMLGTRNGGGAGSIGYNSLAAGIKRGFATANTDLGTSPNAYKVADFPARWADFGYRATHEMSTIEKALIAHFYGQSAKHSYFTGCSTGGQQSLSEAERYPGDYDGIIAGAPANNRTHLHSELLWHYEATHASSDKSALSPSLIAFVTRSIVAACAGKDGGSPADVFLTDPRACRFDLNALAQCSASITTDCVTPEQQAALRTIYAGPANPRTGERIYAPLPFGAESSHLGLAYQEDPNRLPKEHFYPFVWALGADWNPLKFDFDKDEDRVDRKLAAVLNANNPDLTTFEKSVGKLIMFTGTADPIVPFPDAINFYERVVSFRQHQDSRLSSDGALALTQQFFRYYLVPGMAHCGGGPGIDDFGQGISTRNDDLLFRLESWVEQGSAPDSLPATGGRNGSLYSRFQRNICPYPKLPTYTAGAPNLAASFACVDHPRGEVPSPAPRYLR